MTERSTAVDSHCKTQHLPFVTYKCFHFSLRNVSNYEKRKHSRVHERSFSERSLCSIRSVNHLSTSHVTSSSPPMNNTACRSRPLRRWCDGMEKWRDHPRPARWIPDIHFLRVLASFPFSWPLLNLNVSSNYTPSLRSLFRECQNDQTVCRQSIYHATVRSPCRVRTLLGRCTRRPNQRW